MTIIAALLSLASLPAAHTGRAEVLWNGNLQVGGRAVMLADVVTPSLLQLCKDRDEKVYDCHADYRKTLASLVGARGVSCRHVTQVRYRCFVRGRDIGAELIKAGYAVPTRTNSNKAYQMLVDEARRKRIGLWRGYFVHPEQWEEDRKSSTLIKSRSSHE